jgi:hypothetical protein
MTPTPSHARQAKKLRYTAELAAETTRRRIGIV